MAMSEEMVHHTQAQVGVVHQEIDHIPVKVLITLKKVIETRREILETINLGIVINILVGIFIIIFYLMMLFILCFPFIDYSRSPKDRRSRDEYRTNHDRITPEVIKINSAILF